MSTPPFVSPRVRWVRNYVPGQLVATSDMVEDAGWIAIANRETDERAAPQPIGAPWYLTDQIGGISFGEVSHSATQVVYGIRVTPDIPGWIDQLRLWHATGSQDLVLGVYHVADPLGTPRFEALIGEMTILPGEIGAWQTLPIRRLYYAEGETFDLLVALVTRAGEVSFTGMWDYRSANAAPSGGEIVQRRGSRSDELQVHELDDDGADRSAELDNIAGGSRITMELGGMSWDVLDASKTGDVYLFIVEPAAAAADDALSLFTFRHYGIRSLPIVEHPDFYRDEAHVDGLFSASGYDELATTDDAYGLDILVQSASVSDHWDLLGTP